MQHLILKLITDGIFSKTGNETVGSIIPIEGKPNKYLIGYGAKLAILTWNGKYGGATSSKYQST